MNTNMHVHRVGVIRANWDPHIVEGGALRLFLNDGEGTVALTLFDVPAEQARAIAAACDPCDCNGWRQPRSPSIRAEATLPVARLDELNAAE